MASDPSRIIVPGPARGPKSGILNLNLRRHHHIDAYALSIESADGSRRLSIDLSPEALLAVGQWIAAEIYARNSRRST